MLNAMMPIHQLQQSKPSFCAVTILTYILSLEAMASEALKANTSLETIYLNRNQIGDEGAKALAEALTVNKSLTTIDLQLNQIGPDGAKALAEAKRDGLKIYTD